MDMEILRNDIEEMRKKLLADKTALADEFVERVSKRQTDDRSVYVWMAAKKFIREYEAINENRKKLHELETYINEMEEA